MCEGLMAKSNIINYSFLETLHVLLLSSSAALLGGHPDEKTEAHRDPFHDQSHEAHI